ncbi:MAG: hypothetical protein E6H67_04200 [Betaproteobacteria bacterium]|nr:MAG: hypothetical protein E6H67_04200 [Betaproteobacteria bacterium]
MTWIPACAGMTAEGQCLRQSGDPLTWIPACAGMTAQDRRPHDSGKLALSRCARPRERARRRVGRRSIGRHVSAPSFSASRPPHSIFALCSDPRASSSVPGSILSPP